jgi:hypothetical protein
MSKSTTLLDVLKKKIPDIKIHENTLCMAEEWLVKCPVDWMEFVMFAVNLQTKDALVHLICLEDDETAQAFDIIAKRQFHLYVIGKPKECEQLKVWELWCGPDDKDERWYYGGENLRKFCDEKNLYYRSMLDEKGQLMSASQCLYLKEEGEDCRVPVNELPSGNSSLEASTEPA